MNWYIGTAGWSYKDWCGCFYPKGLKGGADYLEYYSQFFNVAEVNATYYAYLKPGLASEWVKKTSGNPEFLFTVKLHQDFTHLRKYNNENIKAVRNINDILAEEGKLGGLLVQFPYSFVKNGESARYVDSLYDLFSDYRLFFEFRNKSWMNGPQIELSSGVKPNVCAIDQPIIGEALPFTIQPIMQDGYIRLHGRNKLAWEDSIKKFSQSKQASDPNARYNYYYSPSEMQEIRLKIEKTAELASGEVFVIFNNHPFGHAPANALELKLMLENIKQEIPMHILLNFPRLNVC
ncbi:MAG: hypothetical protein AMXMBFR48_05630 [Ignavibacteriales bacterium]